MITAAVIGCGTLGTAHATALSKLAEADVSLVCDPAPGVAERLSAQLAPGVRAVTEPDQVIADDSIDAVWVTTPNDSHRDLALQALHAGKHVFVEKPLGRTADECADIAEAARATGRLVMAGYKMRFFDMVAKAKALIPDPISIQVQVLDNRWPDHRWVSDPAIGGGNIASQGCHGTDLIRHLIGRDPLEVYAVGGQFYSHRVPTNLSAVYRFDDDVSATLTVGDADTPPVTSKFFAQVIGDGCSVTCHNRLTELTFHRSGSEPEVFRGAEAPWEVEDAAFCQVIATGAPSPVDARDGWFATAMTEQAIASARTGRPQGFTPPAAD